MEVNHLKQSLLDKLISVDDENVLKQINALIGNVDIEKPVFKVSNRQKQLLEKSEGDIENGRLTTNEELNKDEEEWLNG